MKSVLLLAGCALSCSSAFAITSPDTLIRNFTLDSPSTPTSIFQMPSSGKIIPMQAATPPAPIAESLTISTEKSTAAPSSTGVRKLLADFAMTLRNIRYHRGGREPSTGFDCSGFVRYVYHHTIGKELPGDSASQYLAGDKVDRASMKTGDLVFFRTHGKHVSHVGIYLDNGRFIHSPSSGKRVSISRLDEAYWAKRFVGAKRPKILS